MTPGLPRLSGAAVMRALERAGQHKRYSGLSLSRNHGSPERRRARAATVLCSSIRAHPAVPASTGTVDPSRSHEAAHTRHAGLDRAA